jgi:hypothetical protein
MNKISYYIDLFSAAFAHYSMNNHDFYASPSITRQKYNKYYIELDRQLYRQLKIEFDDKNNLYHKWEPLTIKPRDIFNRQLGIKIF